jgi:hypothetical protein
MQNAQEDSKSPLNSLTGLSLLTILDRLIIFRLILEASYFYSKGVLKNCHLRGIEYPTPLLSRCNQLVLNRIAIFLKPT